jgi:RND superfamily putative drug exporter
MARLHQRLKKTLSGLKRPPTRLTLSTEAIASFCARHPWYVLAGWVVLLGASIALISSLINDSMTNDVSFTHNPESQQAEDLLEERLRGPEQVKEVIIVRSETLTVDDTVFRQFTEGLSAEISGLGPEIVAGGANYYQTDDETLVSADRHTTIMPFVMAGDENKADSNIGKLLSVVEDAERGSSFEVMIAGGASINEDFSKQTERDLATGEIFGVPIALVVLVLVFGAFSAAVIPLVLGGISIVVAIGITTAFGQIIPFSFFVTNVITMIGLAVGIDYSLFVVSRYREERQRGLDKAEAIRAAGATASRAVFFSGFTVVLALLGMFIVPTTIFRSLAGGAIIVVIVSVLISLTLLPAVLGLAGDKVNSIRLPFIGRKMMEHDPDKPGGLWYRATRLVMRFPALSLVGAGALLIGLAVPSFDLNTGTAGVSSLPDGAQTKEAFTVLEEEFSFGIVSPFEIVIDGDVHSEDVQDGVARLEETLSTDTRFGPTQTTVNESGDLALIETPVNADPQGEDAIEALKVLREEYIPLAFTDVAAEIVVGGATATNQDYVSVTDEFTPWVLVFVLGLSFLLLTVVFRSLVVPAKAIIMNLLSVGASYGLLVMVFQRGWGNEILGFQQSDTIEAWVPLWMFSILFGLSMDYHVFLLSRIREHFAHTKDNTESVAVGLKSTAGIITGAALIMTSVFAGVAMGDLVMFQQMGFGLGVAVILDATVIRSILVPASMKLLGDWNWYLPRVLHWLPDIRTEGSAPAAKRAADSEIVS